MDVDLLSESMLEFCRGKVGVTGFSEATRKTIIDNVMTSTPRPSNPKQTIADQAFLAEKLHDGEPDVVITRIEVICSEFFDDLPRRDYTVKPDITQKKQFLCNYNRHFYHLGARKYEKPSFGQVVPALVAIV
jgi:hypothetical protein